MEFFFKNMPTLILLIILAIFLFLPIVSQASFIEATMGTAVVNDATATYNNPAALTLLENSQIILLGTGAQLHDEFTGTVTQSRANFTQSGTANSQTSYFLPSGYFATPISDRVFLGTAVIANSFSRDTEQNSILRYVQPDNNIQAIDLVPAIGFKLTDFLSLGASLNFSQADFNFNATSGFPSLDIPDSQITNKASANAVGADMGMLLKLASATLIGLNYRSSMTYQFNGTSMLDGNPSITSNQYSFDFWTPARYVISINQFLSKALGLIATAQWIKWDIFDNLNINGVATRAGVSNVTVPMYMHNSWVYTLGGYYHLSPKWVIRTAGSYVQSPGNENYQITNGDNIIVGTSIGYKISKTLLIDGSYAHAFIQNQTIDVQNSINTISGIDKGYRDSLSLKLTFNI